MTAVTAVPPPRPRRAKAWLLEGLSDQAAELQGPHGHARAADRRHAWWKVMCLTGVDYFSTLGYQPGIAALAAGAVAPIATVVLVALTLFGALPVYRRVARESPNGEGSIALLERILPFWGGKLFVLVLLGFALTDFLITITLSAADAAAHVVENPLAPAWLHGAGLVITLLLVALLSAVFLRGFSEAIGIAVVLVGTYLALNAVVLVASLVRVVREPRLVGDWTNALHAAHPSWLGVLVTALVVFPKLALGLSGFETGVAVMPQVQGSPSDTDAEPTGRIRGTHRLLTTAAVIMSCYLVLSSIVTTLIIPAREFRPGGRADGRALAFLAHQELGPALGTLYDASTIAILWFAGASAMAGLLNLVPRYLPRYGMAPDWARAIRPLVLVFSILALGVTVAFDADVNAQGGAYATGVLVLMTSASTAAALSARRQRRRALTAGFSLITVLFAYTTGANVVERPDGVRIGAAFIAGILVVSLASRASRAFELRTARVEFDETARRWIQDAAHSGQLFVIANEPGARDAREYRLKAAEAKSQLGVPGWAPLLFLEVEVTDASDFASDLDVRAQERSGYRVLTVASPVVPNTVAAVLLAMRDQTGVTPQVFFTWTEGNPLANLLRFLLFGQGEVAPVTREVLREAEPDPERRPRVRVG